MDTCQLMISINIARHLYKSKITCSICHIVFIAMNTLVGVIVACLAINAFGLPSSQISGGKDALDGLYPYQASLRDSLNRYFCSGAIISAHYVITAAQCLIEKIDKPYNVNVAVGSNYLDTPYALYKATIFIVHAGYNKLLNLNDIGLIYISETILFNEKIQPITLPVVDQNYDNYPLIVTGWGKLWPGGSTPNHLQEIIVKGYSQETCESIANNIKKTHICTFTMMGEGLCYGDAGSPLVADGVLIGLASYSYGACGAGFPDVSTRVFYYKSWINFHTESIRNLIFK